MCFYLKLPTGNIALHHLYNFASRRLIFLMKLFALKDDSNYISSLLEQLSEVEGSECLIEGTVKDRISHFILRLAFSTRYEQAAFLIEAETMLFKIRFQQMSLKEKSKMLRAAERHLLKLDVHNNSNEILAVLYSVIQQLKSTNGLQCTKFESFNERYLTQVPFQYALSLVSCRNVRLHRGIALVSPNEIGALLEFLFSQQIGHEIRISFSKYLHICDQDQRLQSLCEKLEEIFVKNVSGKANLSNHTKEPLFLTQIDLESTLFPPCMRFLHEKLRQCHRLKHSGRVEYTLFLKEIGLSVNDAICFWKKEYSNPHSNCHTAGKSNTCCHHWDADKRRYIYGIRHLYGLEGSRRNYAAHSCSVLQSKALGPLEDGGCPFKHFDVDKLKSHLKEWGMNELDSDSLISLSAMEQYKKACIAYQTFIISSGGLLEGNFPTAPMELIPETVAVVQHCCRRSENKRRRVDYQMEENTVFHSPSSDVKEFDGSFDFVKGKCGNSFSKPSEFYNSIKCSFAG